MLKHRSIKTLEITLVSWLPWKQTHKIYWIQHGYYSRREGTETGQSGRPLRPPPDMPSPTSLHPSTTWGATKQPCLSYQELNTSHTQSGIHRATCLKHISFAKMRTYAIILDPCFMLDNIIIVYEKPVLKVFIACPKHLYQNEFKNGRKRTTPLTSRSTELNSSHWRNTDPVGVASPIKQHKIPLRLTIRTSKVYKKTLCSE